LTDLVLLQVRIIESMDQMRVHEQVLRGRVLNIGLGTRLQVQIGGMDGQFKTILVGMSPEEYLLIQLPMMAGILNKLYEGNRVTVRYMYAGSVYGFHTTILHFITKPSPSLFLTYPKSIEIIELRKGKRVDCFFPGLAKIQDKELQGAIVDISTGGCKFSIDTSGEVRVPPMEVGENFNLSFQLIGSPQPDTFPGRVRSISREQGKVVLGIQFDALDTEIVKSIEALIESFWIIEDHPFSSK
jgi:c-di-GMP-binding flagellar brake protein YcgR